MDHLDRFLSLTFKLSLSSALGTLFSTTYDDRIGENHPKLYVRRTADLPEAAAHQRQKEEAPNLQWFKARLLPASPPTARSLPRRSLLSLRVREKVRRAEMLIGFTWVFFRAQYLSLFCRSSRTATFCSLFSSITDFCLVPGHSLWDVWIFCKWQSPSSHLWWLKRK